MNNTWEWAIIAGGSGNEEITAMTLSNDGSPVLSFHHTDEFNTQITGSLGGADAGIWLYQTDRDGDGFLDGEDNCPKIYNNDQLNYDEDIQGDSCDSDDDNDNVIDTNDDCQYGDKGWFSELSTDHDGDGCKDSTEDFDDDEDGILDLYDDCPKGSVGWVSTIENDENAWGLDASLELEKHVALVVDIHHHWCHSAGEYIKPNDIFDEFGLPDGNYKLQVDFLNQSSINLITDLKESLDKLVINSLYTPKISAIVPPEIPGTRSAIPMKIPLMRIFKLFIN